MGDDRSYSIFVSGDNLVKYLNQDGKVFEEMLIDEKTKEQFQAKILVSQSLEKGYNPLKLEGRGAFLAGEWFVKIVERNKTKP